MTIHQHSSLSPWRSFIRRTARERERKSSRSLRYIYFTKANRAYSLGRDRIKHAWRLYYATIHVHARPISRCRGTEKKHIHTRRCLAERADFLSPSRADFTRVHAGKVMCDLWRAGERIIACKKVFGSHWLDWRLVENFVWICEYQQIDILRYWFSSFYGAMIERLSGKKLLAYKCRYIDDCTSESILLKLSWLLGVHSEWLNL